MKPFSSVIISMILISLAFGQNVKLEQSRLSPRLLNYQGYLTDTLGNPLTNPSVSMTFAIFDAASAGNQKWTETQGTVSISKGIFSVLLGSVTPIPDSVFTASINRYLQLTVAGVILSPRTRIVSAPYAFTATYSDTAIYAKNALTDNDWVISGSNMYSGVSGNVGIGKPSPAVKLDVSGSFNTDSLYRIAGVKVLSAPSTNTFIGRNAGYSNPSGAGNTFTGYYAGYLDTSGQGNTFTGYRAGYSNTSGSYNTFTGYWAGTQNTTGGANTFTGYGAGYYNTTANCNTFLGYFAGHNNTVGAYNIFIGHRAGDFSFVDSNRLYIANNQSANDVLISGNFATNRVGINTTTPTRTLFVNGDAGGTTAWYNDSDERLKKNIKPIENALSDIVRLEGVNFEWKDTANHPGGVQIGLIAQDVDLVVPSVVDKKSEYYSIATANLVPLLIEAIKEQQVEIEALKAQIAKLK